MILGANDLDPAWRRRPRPEGRYVSTGWIPGNLLAEGTVFVDVAVITIEPAIAQFLEQSTVAFQVIDNLEGDSHRGDWAGPQPGTVRPLLEWTTQYRRGSRPQSGGYLISHAARTRARFTRTSGAWELLLLVCLALLLRVLWIAFFMRGAAIEPPGAEYADAARSLARHDYAAAFVTGTTGVISPVYPVLLASASLLTQDVLSPAGTARLVTAAFGALLVVPVYLIAAFLYSRRVAAIAACAVALHPLLLKTSATALPDSIYLALLLAGTYFLLRLSRDRDTLSAITGGAFFGLAGLTSPEGVLCFIASVLIIALGVRQPWRETARQITVVLLAAAAVLAPYAALAIDAGLMPFQTTLMTASLNLAQLPAALTAVSLVASLVLGTLAALGLLWSRANGIAPQLLLTNVVIGSAMGSASLPAIGLLPVLLIWASHGLSELPRRLGERFGVGQHHPAWMQVVFAAAIISLMGVPVYRGVTEGGRASWILWDAGLWLREVAPVKKQVMDVSASIPFHASAQYVPFPQGDSRTAFEVISRLGVDFIVVRTARAVSPSYLSEWLDHGVPDARARLVYSRQGRDAEQIAVYKWLVGADDFQHASVLHYSGDQAGPRAESAALDGSRRGALKRNPQNPRYFTDESGRAIYLTGAHTWANLQDGDRLEPLNRFDFEQYLTFLQNHQLNFIRLWAWEQADWVPWRPYHFRIAPMPYLRVGPSAALDGKPQFDVTRFDDEVLSAAAGTSGCGRGEEHLCQRNALSGMERRPKSEHVGKPVARPSISPSEQRQRGRRGSSARRERAAHPHTSRPAYRDAAGTICREGGGHPQRYGERSIRDLQRM